MLMKIAKVVSINPFPNSDTSVSEETECEWVGETERLGEGKVKEEGGEGVKDGKTGRRKEGEEEG